MVHFIGQEFMVPNPEFYDLITLVMEHTVAFKGDTQFLESRIQPLVFLFTGCTEARLELMILK